MIKVVFGVLAGLMLSFVLWEMVLGDVARGIMWDGTHSGLLETWNFITLDNGTRIGSVYNTIFNSAGEFKWHGDKAGSGGVGRGYEQDGR